MPVHRDQIERSHWTKDGQERQTSSEGHHHPIRNEKVRDEVYRARFQLKYHNTTARNKGFVNEDLTATRGALVYHTRQLKKEGHITDCWTTAGKVLSKTKDGLVVNISVDSELCAYGQVWTVRTVPLVSNRYQMQIQQLKWLTWTIPLILTRQNFCYVITNNY